MVAVVGLAGLTAMWGDVEASHASAASSLRLLRMGDQWAHFVAAGIWGGGLFALLTVIGLMAAGDRRQAARRFSTAALASVVVIALTGFQRAYDEIGAIHRLFHAAFGQYVLIKVILLGALVVLGAVNRYRSIPRLPGSTGQLTCTGRVELILIALVLVATGIIQGMAPPSSVAASAPHPLVLRGHDFATTTRVTLSINPGKVGFNEFHVTFIGVDGQELPMAALTVTATPGGPLTVRRLDQVGHFVADLNGETKGAYRFQIAGTTNTGDTLQGTLTIPVR